MAEEELVEIFAELIIETYLKVSYLSNNTNLV